MAIPRHIQEASEQADELIKAQATSEQETSQDSVELAAEPDEVQPDPSKEKVSPDDYKERYARYKAGTDQTIHQLRTQLGERDRQMHDLQSRISQMNAEIRILQERKPTSSDPIDNMGGVLSEDELERFDKDDLRVISKIASAQANSQVGEMRRKMQAMEQELARTRANEEHRTRQQAEEATRQAQQSFVDKLRSKLPEIHEIDADPDFRNWLDEPDSDSGVVRRNLAMHAMQAQDVKRVLDVYREWMAVKRPAHASRDSRVVPRQTASSPASVASNGDLWTRKKVEDFYTKWRQGRIPDERAREIEKDLFAAQTDGRFR